jgi:transposase InsO family protein
VGQAGAGAEVTYLNEGTRCGQWALWVSLDADDSLAAITQDRVPPLSQWAYRRPFLTNGQREDALPAWLAYYNTQRRHQALAGQVPISRLSSMR